MTFTDGENGQTDSAPYVEGETQVSAPVTNEDRPADRPSDAAPDLAAQEEAVARARGWVPKDDFRGPSENWQDAKSFLDRNASLQTDVRELRQRLDQREREYQEKIGRLERVSDAVLQRTREDALRQIEAAKREAVELSDTEAYDRATREETKLFDRFRKEDEAARPQQEAKEEQPQVTLLPETQAWIASNPWFESNKAMHNVALGFYEEASERYTSEKEKLSYVDQRLASVYPDRFADRAAKPASNMPSLEGGNRTPSGGKNQIDQLPPEARAAAERFIKRGVIKDMNEYAKMYFEA
jgi:hypothetical protein